MSVSHLNEEDCVYWKNRDQLKADCWHMYMSLCADAYRQCGEGEEGSVCVCGRGGVGFSNVMQVLGDAQLLMCFVWYNAGFMGKMY